MANKANFGTDFAPVMWWADIDVANTEFRRYWTRAVSYLVIPGVPFIFSLSYVLHSQNHWITMTCCAPALNCHSRNKRFGATAPWTSHWCPTVFSPPSCLPLYDRPSQPPMCTVRNPDSGPTLETSKLQGWYFKDDSTTSSDAVSKVPRHLSRHMVSSLFSAVVVKGFTGSFRLAAGYRHLHSDFNSPSLGWRQRGLITLFVQVGTSPGQGISLP